MIATAAAPDRLYSADHKLRAALVKADPHRRNRLGRVRDFWPQERDWSQRTFSAEVWYDPTVNGMAEADGQRILLGQDALRVAQPKALAAEFFHAVAVLDHAIDPIEAERYAKDYDHAIRQAIDETDTGPTEAQAEAGNYRKGKLPWNGLTIRIENPKGSRRRPEWPPLSAHYGYISRTEGKDGDAVDVYIGPEPESEIVFVIDQVTEGGRFDEHKCVLGTTTEADAKALYLANYPSGWKCGPITAMTVAQFKAWLDEGDTTRRVNEQVSRYAAMPAAVSPGQPYQSDHQIGDTKAIGGKTYRLNQNHRWELDNDQDGQHDHQEPGMSGQPQQGKQSHEQPDTPEKKAARHKFVASQIGSVNKHIGGLIKAIHYSSHYHESGEVADFDVHQKTAGSLYEALKKNAGKAAGGGQVVDLGQGRVGFASKAGSIAIWPADASGKHRISYTNKTGIVERAMGGGEPQPQVSSAIEQVRASDSAGTQTGTKPPRQPAHETPASGTLDTELEQPGDYDPEHTPAPGQAEPQAKGQSEDEPIAPPVDARPHRAKADAAKQEYQDALEAWQHVARTNPGRHLNALHKTNVATKKQIWQHHEKAAVAAEKDVAKTTEANEKARRDKVSKAEKEALERTGAGDVLKGKKPTSKQGGKDFSTSGQRSLKRDWKAGYNTGSVEFESDDHRDLHDLGAQMRRAVTARNFPEHERQRIAQSRHALAQRMGKTHPEISQLAADVHKSAKEQAKGIQDGEHRKLKMPEPSGQPAAKAPASTEKEKPAPLLESAAGGKGGGYKEPPTNPERDARLKMPKKHARLHDLADKYLGVYGVEPSEASKAAISKAIQSGRIAHPRHLRSILKNVKPIHQRMTLKGAEKRKKSGQPAPTHHDALLKAINHKANREGSGGFHYESEAKGRAKEHGIDHGQYEQLGDDLYESLIAHHKDREKAKEYARQLSGMSQHRIHQLENKGLDSATAKFFDQYGQEVHSEHPDLWGDDEDHGEKLWELIKEGKKAVPNRRSRAYLKHLDDYLMEQGSRSVAPVASTDDATPFAKVRAGLVQRYRKWLKSRQ